MLTLEAVAIYLRHIEFLLSCAGPTLSAESEISETSRTFAVDTDVAEFLVADTTRSMLRRVVQRGQGLLSESHLLWQLWLDWEMSILQAGEDSTR